MLKIKRGQLEISFGMIFSIILIIAFISVAVYVIYKFLGFQSNVTKRLFIENLQEPINEFWQGTDNTGQVAKTLEVPRGVEKICFIDFSKIGKPAGNELYNDVERFKYTNINLFFYPLGVSEGDDLGMINHLYLNSITEKENPNCIKALNGKVHLIIEKIYGENLVRIREDA